VSLMSGSATERKLDSVGPIGRTVGCCSAVDAILSGTDNGEEPTRAANDVKLGVLTNFVQDDLDPHVAKAFDGALAQLRNAGVTLTDTKIPVISDIPAANVNGGIAPAEAWTHHRDNLNTNGDEYDPRVAFRIRMGEKQSATDYIETLQNRKRIIADAHAATCAFDAIVMPTVAHIPPRLSDISTDDDYVRLNMLTLRNTSVGNFLDRCAISLPITPPGDAPVGLMLMGEHGSDEKLFRLAEAIEDVIQSAIA